MEQYIPQIYDSKRPTAMSNLAELIWYIFSKHQYESDKLPSTKMDLDQKILRAILEVSTYILTHIARLTRIYGWALNKITNLYHPRMTKNPLVPDTVAELS